MLTFEAAALFGPSGQVLVMRANLAANWASLLALTGDNRSYGRGVPRAPEIFGIVEVLPGLGGSAYENHV